MRKTKTNLSRVSFWTADKHRHLIADAFGIEPIGEMASAASLESFIQPELNEAFFCAKLVLVEGPEDKAILRTVLKRKQLYTDFLRLGGLILGVNGKANLINMIALARGFETPHFVVFDADTHCSEDQKTANKALNGKILKLLKIDAANLEWPEEDVFKENLIIWTTNIQGTISGAYKQWTEDVKAVCTEFGWKYDRLKKNPSVISYALERVLNRQEIKSLSKVADALMEFANAGP